MRTGKFAGRRVRALLVAVTMLLSGAAWGHPQDGFPSPGSPVGGSVTRTSPYTVEDLAWLVGPIALYPDDLVAIILPASMHPLQVIEAGRFLERLDHDPDLIPPPGWDDSVVALLNYPPIVELLNQDLGWTRRLGEAAQTHEPDVIDAIARFREQAWSAGNLRSDEYQRVIREDGVLRIVPADPRVIHVPYYEPRRVVYYSPRPVYHYHPLHFPSYYYPYPPAYAFGVRYFWGVTSVFSVAWRTHHLQRFHHTHRSHPYHGRRYQEKYHARRPGAHRHGRATPSRPARPAARRAVPTRPPARATRPGTRSHAHTAPRTRSQPGRRDAQRGSRIQGRASRNGDSVNRNTASTVVRPAPTRDRVVRGAGNGTGRAGVNRPRGNPDSTRARRPANGTSLARQDTTSGGPGLQRRRAAREAQVVQAPRRESRAAPAPRPAKPARPTRKATRPAATRNVRSSVSRTVRDAVKLRERQLANSPPDP